MKYLDPKLRTAGRVIAWTGVCGLAVAAALAAPWGSSQSLQGAPSLAGPSAWQAPQRNRVAQASAAPTPRDCGKLVSQPNPPYSMEWKHWPTNGYGNDIGQVLNSMGVAAHELQADLGDLQIRIEQLRCENRNLSDKLDYIIRKLPQ